MRSSSHNPHQKKKIRRHSRSHQRRKLKKRLSLSDDGHLSFSSSYPDDSKSISSFSDSEHEFGSRKRRRTQGDSKSNRKRATHSSRHGDDLKKRKKTKLKGHTASGVKKKKPVKRKRRNTRYLSSDSCGTCSTCGGCSSSGDSELESSRKQDKSKLGTRGRKRYRSRSHSPSCSGCSRRSHCPSEERFVEESFPKRLGSIITVVKQSNETEQRDWTKDENKADIIQAYDDCPSSRSNDSYDDGRKREGGMILPVHGDHMLENKRHTDGNVDGGIQCSQKDPVLSDFGLNPASLFKKSDVSMDTGSSEVDELELRLRIKALENFTKFRRGLYANAKSLVDQKDENAVAKQSAAKAESIQKAEAAGISADEKLASSTEVCGGICDVRHAHESNAKLKINTLPSAGSRMPIAGNATGKPHKSTQLASAFRHDPSGSGHSINNRVVDVKSVHVDDHTIISDAGTSSKENEDILKQAPKILESSNKMLLEKTLDRNVSVIPEATHVSKLSTDGLEINNVDGSAPKVSSSCNPKSGDHALKDQKVDEAKVGSQFEQKTMSVMRGGEMVQVSYKVYIPKKPPALARRQLQR